MQILVGCPCFSAKPAAFAANIDPVPDVPLFSLEAVSFAIPGRLLLESLTLTLPARSVVGLIGHNGSGKSTLIKLLGRPRVWLAMPIAQDAECLLLDEPISVLDVAHRIEVLSLVHRLSKDRSLSIVVVLHDVNMAGRFCDEIIALHSGRLVAHGTPRTIIASAALEAIYGIPTGVMPHPDTQQPISFVR